MYTTPKAKVKRTYGSRTLKQANPPSSPISELRSSSPPPIPARANRPSRLSSKRPFEPENTPEPNSPKRVKLALDPKPPVKTRHHKKPKLTQLQLVPDQSLLRTCNLCSLSYIRGAADDESLHRTHCSRVRRGMEWGKEEDRQLATIDGKEVACRVRLKDGPVTGRIIAFRADATGKIGTKLTTLLETINLNLSAPPLPPDVLRKSKAYLFLASSLPTSSREKIIGCVIAQQIETAMKIASPDECNQACLPSPSESAQPISSPTHKLITIDSPDYRNSHRGVFAHPKPIPTPLGISRILVASSHRRQGVATALLDSILKTFIHGCVLDPMRGHVAFTQPTGDGGALMRAWGGEAVRVYNECAS